MSQNDGFPIVLASDQESIPHKFVVPPVGPRAYFLGTHPRAPALEVGMGTSRFTLRFGRSKEGSPGDQKASAIHNSSNAIPGAVVGSPGHPVAKGRRGRRETRKPTGRPILPRPFRERLW